MNDKTLDPVVDELSTAAPADAPVYHLRQYGDVSPAEMEHFVKHGTLAAQSVTDSHQLLNELERFDDWLKRMRVAHPDTLFTDSEVAVAWLAWQAAKAEQAAETASLQARIDALMFEYCPNEMTRDQIDEWARHQRVAEIAELKAGK